MALTAARVRLLATIAVFLLAAGWCGWLTWTGSGVGDSCPPPSLVQQEQDCLSTTTRIVAGAAVALYTLIFATMAAVTMTLMFMPWTPGRVFAYRVLAVTVVVVTGATTVLAASMGWETEESGAIAQLKTFAKPWLFVGTSVMAWINLVRGVRSESRGKNAA